MGPENSWPLLGERAGIPSLSNRIPKGKTSYRRAGVKQDGRVEVVSVKLWLRKLRRGGDGACESAMERTGRRRGDGGVDEIGCGGEAMDFHQEPLSDRLQGHFPAALRWR